MATLPRIKVDVYTGKQINNANHVWNAGETIQGDVDESFKSTRHGID